MTASEPPPTTNADKFERLNRLYSALSHVRLAITWMPTRERLLQKVCEVLVEHGRFGRAWIGWHDPNHDALVLVAHEGDEDTFLRSVEAYTDERPGGLGPSALALSEKRPYLCNDLLADVSALPWRAELERRGYRASAAFPIRVSGRVCGTLNVCSEHLAFFRNEETALLNELASDLSLALDGLAAKKESLQAEAEAEREKRFADNLIEAMPGIFYLYDQQGVFLRWNRNFEKVSGYSAEEIARMHPLDFFSAEDKPRLERRIAEVFAGGASNIEASLWAKDGTLTPYFFTGKRILFEETTCLAGIGVDVSERKRVEEALSKSEYRYRTTLDNILEGCQLLAFDWRYLYLNAAAATQNRRPNSELLGKSMQEAWPGIEHSEVFAMLKRCMEERRPMHGETEFDFPDGTKGWFDVRAQPVPEGVFVLSIDISERKQAERALHELNESLERKVVERTDDLRSARERAESADRLKSAFLATMSHELRTPLNSILGFTGIILQGLAGPLNDEQAKQLGMVQGSARHLLELINDVLDISKIEAGQLEVHFASFDLRMSIARAVDSVKLMAEKKGLSLRAVVPETLQHLHSDRRRVEQILLNLLNNAIKFSERGEVTISAELVTEEASPASAKRREFVRISVSDRGTGMKPASLAVLFQPFRQVDSGLQRQHEGTGLGLAICRRLTDLLGGTIGVESTWGEGSVFSVVLPLQRGELK